MTILGFLLAPDSGEKLTLRKLEFLITELNLLLIHHNQILEITILLSIVMFSLLLSEILPPSSNAIPIISVYFMCVMSMSSISVIASVIVISLHFRNAKNYDMPIWVSTKFKKSNK
jgi:nicotinic acetylcholine receptor